MINFTYTILEEEDLSYQGNHPLAIFKSEESYQYLKSALTDIISEVQELNTIKIEETTWHIEYYLGGDWKFLAIVTGVYMYVCMLHVCVCVVCVFSVINYVYVVCVCMYMMNITLYCY